MKKVLMLFAMLVATLVLTACGGNDADSGDYDFSQPYDVLQINGVKHACYGYRSASTYSSLWNSTKHCGRIMLPCGDLTDAQNAAKRYSYFYDIRLKGNQDLRIGSKLEDFNLKFEKVGETRRYPYISGSATVMDKVDDKYITIKFDSFSFDNGSKSYTLNGTVQLQLTAYDGDVDMNDDAANDKTPMLVMMEFYMDNTKDMLKYCDIEMTFEDQLGNKKSTVLTSEYVDADYIAYASANGVLPVKFKFSRKVTLKENIDNLEKFEYSTRTTAAYAIFNSGGYQLYNTETGIVGQSRTVKGAEAAQLINQGVLDYTRTFKYDEKGNLIPENNTAQQQ